MAYITAQNGKRNKYLGGIGHQFAMAFVPQSCADFDQSAMINGFHEGPCLRICRWTSQETIEVNTHIILSA